MRPDLQRSMLQTHANKTKFLALHMIVRIKHYQISNHNYQIFMDNFKY